MAVIATGDREDALEIVQDSMIKLTSKYADKKAQEWGPLFQRILQSTIRDWYRRNKVRHGILRLFGIDEREQEYGPDAYAAGNQDEPEQRAKTDTAVAVLDEALRALPLRQQQVFLLREFEGLNVRDTAAALGISEGSVKTHYSRAVHTLREQLEGHWP
jgi:RNA polymerase sigma-70 factor (ECF subfamily)